MSKFYKLVSVSFAIFLFTVGNLPAASKVFPGVFHWPAHFAAYAAIGITIGMGWKNLRWFYIAAIVATIGFLQEATEITFHGHPFEWVDAIVDSVGGLSGALLVVGMRVCPFIQSK